MEVAAWLLPMINRGGGGGGDNKNKSHRGKRKEKKKKTFRTYQAMRLKFLTRRNLTISKNLETKLFSHSVAKLEHLFIGIPTIIVEFHEKNGEFSTRICMLGSTIWAPPPQEGGREREENQNSDPTHETQRRRRRRRRRETFLYSMKEEEEGEEMCCSLFT